jgi:hypothetical protein
LLKIPLRLDREGSTFDVPEAEVVATNESAFGDANGLKYGVVSTYPF